ncbi:MAG: T9SS type A sorting domain-containing protein [Saprospiraceae bacterium]
MKTFILAFLLLLSCCLLRAQCPVGNVVLTSQNEVNAFYANWPQCDTIHGDLFIGKATENSNIASVVALSRIKHIDGSLYVWRNSNLIRLSGLHNLQQTGKHISIEKNPRLITLGNLSNLKTIGDSLDVSDNDQLTDFGALDQLDTIKGNVNIRNNSSLTDYFGFDELNYIGGSLNIEQNYYLTSLNGLNQLTFIGKDLRISENVLLSDLGGLEGLDTVAGRLMIVNTPAISNLVGLGGLSYTEELILQGNIGLEALEGMGAAVVGRAIRIAGNYSLTNLSDLELFDGFRGDLYIGLSALPDLSGLAGMDSLRSLKLVENLNLVSLAGLETLTALDSSLVIRDNPLLNDLSALNHAIWFGGDELVIAENDLLSDCAVQAVCEWLAGQDILNLDISNNRDGCQNRAEVEEACLDKNITETMILLSPNPFSNVLEIHINTPYEAATMRLWDISGRILHQATFTRHREFDLSVLSPGVYIIEIQFDGQLIVKRVVKGRI